jgi:hypothetical protein
LWVGEVRDFVVVKTQKKEELNDQLNANYQHLVDWILSAAKTDCGVLPIPVGW